MSWAFLLVTDVVLWSGMGSIIIIDTTFIITDVTQRPPIRQMGHNCMTSKYPIRNTGGDVAMGHTPTPSHFPATFRERGGGIWGPAGGGGGGGGGLPDSNICGL